MIMISPNRKLLLVAAGLLLVLRAWLRGLNLVISLLARSLAPPPAPATLDEAEREHQHAAHAQRERDRGEGEADPAALLLG